MVVGAGAGTVWAAVVTGAGVDGCELPDAPHPALPKTTRAAPTVTMARNLVISMFMVVLPLAASSMAAIDVLAGS